MRLPSISVEWLSNEVRPAGPHRGVARKRCVGATGSRSAHHGLPSIARQGREIVNVIIGVDPHKATTPPSRSMATRASGEIQVRANASQLKRLLRGPRRRRSGPGRSRAPAVAATCSPNSSSLPGRTSSTCPPPWRSGSGARFRQVEQERPRRRPLDRCRRATDAAVDPGPAVAPPVGAPAARQTEQPAVEQPDPHYVPAPRAAGRARPGRISQQTQGERRRTDPSSTSEPGPGTTSSSTGTSSPSNRHSR